MKKFQMTIGLEIHVSITEVKTKLFSRGCNNSDQNHPNTNLDLLDIGLPGALPILNQAAVLSAIRSCFALNMKINDTFTFDRKSYFYPDLPLGYQITQFFHPIGVEGYIPIYASGRHNIRIKQLHLETDAGKSVHENKYTLLDFNRSGSPLMEIVTYPDMHSIEETLFFIRTLRSSIKHTGVSDVEMESGNFRVDVNISVSQNEELGNRVEIKNLNSYRSIRQAIEFEYDRQIQVITDGQTVNQETRLFDEKAGCTIFMRDKQEADGYMYFPDPDLPKFTLDGELIAHQKHLPLMPYKLMERLYNELAVRENLLNLVEEPIVSNFVNSCLEGLNIIEQKQVLKIICGRVFAKLKEDICIPIHYKNLQKLAKLILEERPTEMVIKAILDDMWESDEDPFIIMQEKGMSQIKDVIVIRKYIQDAIKNNPNERNKYIAGKTNLRAFFLGKVMKESGSRANIEITNSILDEELNLLTHT